MSRLLIVDDERNTRLSLVRFFESLGHQTSEAESGEQAMKMLAAADFDLVLSDCRLAEMSGLDLLRDVRHLHPQGLIVLMTAYATVESAVAAMKAGAFDYVTKPFSLEQIRLIVERALQLQDLQAKNRVLRETIGETPLLGSHSSAMLRLLETAHQAAQSEATVLLVGESGTGKNVLARQIHDWSCRHLKSFVLVNCTTLSEELLESELFGHVRGAFTGAIKDKPGRLEAAAGGAVFLDEIADLSPRLQTKLLRFIQEQDFERVGSNRTIRVDARIIAATNRDLEGEVAAHQFREDLFSRLNVITLRVPALRQRREDILPLAEWILKSASIRNRRSPMSLSPDAAAAIMKYPWPGNVRELRNSLERAAVLAKSDVIQAQDLPDGLFRDGARALMSARHTANLEELEREHIIRVLRECVTLEQAAATLGINVATLWRKRKRFNIEH